jgi:hypothetical protein
MEYIGQIMKDVKTKNSVGMQKHFIQEMSLLTDKEKQPGSKETLHQNLFY